MVQQQFLSHLAGAAGGSTHSVDLEERKGFQKSIVHLFATTPIGSVELHLRRRLDRWTGLGTLPGHRPNRACRVMEVLSRKATPRIQAAYLRTICNGWCTRHRFQGQGACAFGCGGGYDKLEHYACCTKVGDLMSTHLNVGRSQAMGALDDFLCMSDGHEEVIKDRAVGLYALYRLYNGIRHNQFSLQEHKDAFKRYIREGLR
jgi:hypothetical protein